MFSKILVATDMSEASSQVICPLGNLKTLGTREALLVHCFNVRDVGGLANQLMELNKPPFEKQKKMLEEQGFRTTGKMVIGFPHIEINRIAEESNCSMIVIGSHGQTMAEEILLGSVANAIIHSATKPVLILRLKLKNKGGTKKCEPAECAPLNHVLFPTDFSDNAEYAFRYVKKIAECGAKKITLLHIQDKARIEKHLKAQLDKFNKIDTTRLERLKSELIKIGAKNIQIEISYGIPKKEIVEFTNSSDISLVVMGSRGRGYVSELFLGSVSHAIARHSEGPVLLIPTP